MEQEMYKKKYSIKEFYPILVAGLRTLPLFRKVTKENIISQAFVKRIMLAVTEVNGCAVCSYAHTNSALEMGMPKEEIANILGGITEDLPAEEAPAILFAQHYADTKGRPTEEAWQRVLAMYGDDQAHAILSAIRTIMVGNSYGLTVSAFKDRRKGQPVLGSSLGREVGFLSSIIVLLPLAAIQAGFQSVRNKALLAFAN